jgi:hypothetical protein
MEGRLLDTQTNEPVVFATIRIKTKALGVITNMDGSFRIPTKFKEYGDMLEMSSMGYKTKEISMDVLEQDKLNLIFLDPGVIGLKEAIVEGKDKSGRRLGATQIVRRAIRAIPSNYPRRLHAVIGYYRDYQLKKARYVNLNEAILEVVDSGFEQNDHATTKVRLYDYHSNSDFERDSMGSFKYDYKNYTKYIDKAYLFNYGGNEFSILRIHDAIRNHAFNSYDFVNVMDRDFISNHFFKKEDEIRLDDEMLYKISFAQNLWPFRIAGTIYIAKKDFAIHKMEYSLYDKSRTTDNKEKDKHGINNEIIFEVITEYKRKLDKMYLNYISFSNNFEVRMPPKFFLKETVAKLSCECFVLTFNNYVDTLYAKEKKYYDFKFNGKKIQIDSIGIDQKTVFVYPDMDRSEFSYIIYQLFAAKRTGLELSNKLRVEVTGLRDMWDPTGIRPELSNLINDREYITYRQFREFFVQEIKSNGSVLKDTLFMKKDIPIFKDQAIVKPDNFDDYWMNTPLQNVKN